MHICRIVMRSVLVIGSRLFLILDRGFGSGSKSNQHGSGSRVVLGFYGMASMVWSLNREEYKETVCSGEGQGIKDM
jgi:hypothetical protein